MDKRQEELEKKLKALRREHADTKPVVDQMTSRLKVVENEIRQIETRLKQIAKPKNLVVSDHAVLRYMERHQNIAVEEVRAEIAAKLEGVQDLGSLKFAGWVVQGHTVVTYVEPTS